MPIGETGRGRGGGCMCVTAAGEQVRVSYSYLPLGGREDSKGIGLGKVGGGAVTFSWFTMSLRAASMRAEKGCSAATPSATIVVGDALSRCASSSKDSKVNSQHIQSKRGANAVQQQ